MQLRPYLTLIPATAALVIALRLAILLRCRLQRFSVLRAYPLQREVVPDDGVASDTNCPRATFIVEPKCLRGGAAAGHISLHATPSASDVLLAKLYNKCVELTRELGCYKVIIDAPPRSADILRQCGFELNSLTMVANIHGTAGSSDSALLRGDLPQYKLRELEEADSEAYVALLAQLSSAPQLSKDAWSTHLSRLRESCGTLFTVVVTTSSQKLVGCASLLLEHDGSSSHGAGGGVIEAHIEDVVVDSSTRGTGLGKALILALVELARGKGARRVLLNCSEANEPFYVKCGFAKPTDGTACYACYSKSTMASSASHSALATQATTPGPKL